MLEGKTVNLRVVEREDLPLLTEWQNTPEFSGEFMFRQQKSRAEAEKEYDDRRPDSKTFFIEKKDGARPSQVVGPCVDHSGARAFGMLSDIGRYGFMSTIGVPATASMPLIVKVHPSTFNNSTTQRPIGFGRDGLLQANTPV